MECAPTIYDVCDGDINAVNAKKVYIPIQKFPSLPAKQARPGMNAVFEIPVGREPRLCSRNGRGRVGSTLRRYLRGIFCADAVIGGWLIMQKEEGALLKRRDSVVDLILEEGKLRLTKGSGPAQEA